MKKLILKFVVLLLGVVPVAAHGEDVFADTHMAPWFFGFGMWHMLLWVIVIVLAVYGLLKLINKK